MDAGPPSPGRLAARALAGLLTLVLVLDLWGWPGLALPLAGLLGTLLDRPVTVAAGGTRFHFIGGLRVESGRLGIAAPPWSGDPYFLDGRDIRLHLAYRDLWRTWRGDPLTVRRMEAAGMQVHARRLADGRGSWPLGDRAKKPDTPRRGLPVFHHLVMGDGQVAYRDDRRGLALVVRLHTREGMAAGGHGLRAEFTGRYRDRPVAGRLAAGGVLPLVGEAGNPVPLHVEVSLADLEGSFTGTATDVLHLGDLRGRFRVAGGSLADLGTLLGATLPSTGAFLLRGEARKAGRRWQVLVEQAQVGRSRLEGELVYDRTPAVPRLSGRVVGRQMLLSDLAPSIGARGKAAPKPAGGRVLPDKAFHLPALARMDADLQVEVAHLELGHAFARPIAPLRTRLVLRDGVLRLNTLEASIAGGTLEGVLSLDGRGRTARWQADLAWRDVDLARWLRRKGDPDSTPPLSGALHGRLEVTGEGRSTAEILGSLNGSAQLTLRHGRLSHLAVEAAGVDLAQALGVMVGGDRPLPVRCAVARFRARDGVFRTEGALLDTPDSTLSLEGDVQLAEERLDLRLVALPKDFSPLSLRTPVRIRGSLGKPEVSLEGGRLATRLGASALLSLVAPWAALIPLMDTGNEADGGPGCQAVLERVRAHRPADRAGPHARERPPGRSRPAARSS